MQEDRGRDYMNARRVAKEYEVVTKGLNKNAASVPPQNTPDEQKQVITLCCWLFSTRWILSSTFVIWWFVFAPHLSRFVCIWCIFLMLCFRQLLFLQRIMWGVMYCVQVQLWKNYIQWEKNNPLRTEDTTLITKRGERWSRCDSVTENSFAVNFSLPYCVYGHGSAE